MSETEEECREAPPEKLPLKEPCEECDARHEWVRAAAILTILYVGVCIGVLIGERRSR